MTNVQQNTQFAFNINTDGFLPIFAVVMHFQKSATFAIILKIHNILLPNHMDINLLDSKWKNTPAKLMLL